MDSERFDDLTRAIATRLPRRVAVRWLAGAALGAGALAGEIDLSLGKKKNKKKKKKKGKPNKGNGDRPQPPDRPCPGGCVRCQTCVDGTCTDLFPLCRKEDCMEPICSPITWQWECWEKRKPQCDPAMCEAVACNPLTGEFECATTPCPDDEVCCHDRCVPACFNGCEMDTYADCPCQKPPEGMTFCPSWLRCVDTKTDVDHCGGCGQTCPRCGDQCPEYRAEFSCCDGACRHITENRNHCGGCGIQCAYEEECRRGKCVPACEFDDYSGKFCGRNPAPGQPLGHFVCTTPTRTTCYKTCSGYWDVCGPNQAMCRKDCEERGICGCAPDECRAACD